MTKSASDIIANAIVKFNEGRTNEATLDLANIPFASYKPESTNHCFVLGAILARYGRTKLAIDALTEAYNANPRDHNIASYLGDLLLSYGDLTDAAYYLTKSLRIKKLSGKESTIVFGDSHVDYCFGGIPWCKVFSFPGVTMHRIGRDGLNAVNIKAYGVPEGKNRLFAVSRG